MRKQTLTDKLVESRLCADKKQAAALVMAGKVLVNNQPARAGCMVKEDDKVRLKDQKFPYASKGGLKLEGALSAMHIDVAGKVCLDAGASTGGFTDCLLHHDALMVYAVDAGFGQLTGFLRQNEKVRNLEKTNLSDPVLLSLEPQPMIATCDLSYLSLKDAVPLYRDILHNQGELIALVKPLFEIDDPQARRSGQIPAAAFEPLLMELSSHLNSLSGVRVCAVCASPVTGNAGTIEFFFHILFGAMNEKFDLNESIKRSVAEALQIQRYKKAGDLTFG